MLNDYQNFTHLVKKQAYLFDYLKEDLILSLRQTKALMKSNCLFVNEQSVSSNQLLQKGDSIRIYFEDETHDYQPELIPLDIIYETDDLLIINKPPHIVVHETKSHDTHTIANGISYYFQSIDLKRKIRFVNRLDMDTSGLLIVAKNAYAHQFLAKQFEQDITDKVYLAIVSGVLEEEHYQVTKPLEKTGELYKTVLTGKASETIVDVIKRYDRYTITRCILKTGRTHQIRVHLASLGTPILGDSLYGGDSSLLNRQALHAHQLTFIEPRTYKEVTITAPIPNDMEKLLK